jgi:hypothetical protein
MVVQLQMVFQILLLLFSIFDAIFGQAINSSSQKASCGNVNDIPFPFGIGVGCYLFFFSFLSLLSKKLKKKSKFIP